MALSTPAIEVPYHAPQALEHLEQTHVNLTVTPNDDKMLSYRLAVPANWVYSKELGPVVDDLFTPRGLGLFAPSEAPGAPFIAVTVTPLAYEIPIDVWVRLRLERDGWTVVASRWIPGRHALFHDVTATRTANGAEQVVRTTARLDGNRLFSVNSVCTRRQWEKMKEIFFVAHASFEVRGTMKTTRIEARKEIQAANPDFQISYPFTWIGERPESPTARLSAVDIKLPDAAQRRALAYLQVRAERRPRGATPTSLKVLEQMALARLRQAGFIPSAPSVPLSLRDDPRGPSVKGWLGGVSSQGQLGDVDAVLRLGFVRRGDLDFAIMVLSPPLGDDTMAALRAIRAFEIARDSLQLPD